MRFYGVILAALALLLGCGKSNAPYPNQAITIVCPWNAGGGTDRLSRFMADQLQANLGQPVMVANKTGGSGAIGFAAGANAPADGYTITMATFELSTMHWLGISKLTYQNFTPLIQLNGDAAAIIVRKDSPFTSLTNLLDHARAKPGAVKMSGTAKGAAWDLARSGMLMAAGLPIESVVWVPTDGAAPAIVALLGNHIDAISCSVPEALPQIESGELRVLAVMSSQRLPEFPQFPTCKELGIDWEAVGYRGLALPHGATQPVVDTLSKAAMEIAQSEAFKNFMGKNGFAPIVRGPAEFGEFLKAQDAQWHKVILGSTVGATSLQSNPALKSSDPGPWAIPLGALAFIIAGSVLAKLRAQTEPTPPVAAVSPAPVGPSPKPGGRPHHVSDPRAPSEGERDRVGGLSDAPEPPSERSLLTPIAALVVYLLVMPWTGFFLATTFFAALAGRYLGRSWRGSALAALVLMGVVYLLFVQLFKVPLPKGVLF